VQYKVVTQYNLSNLSNLSFFKERRGWVLIIRGLIIEGVRLALWLRAPLRGFEKGMANLFC